jgi:GDP-4-dehydro-6-deoxy-D-mannose reductase
MNQGEKGEVYNVGSGVTYSVKEILQKLINLRGQEIKIVVDQQRFRPIDVPIVLADNSKLSQLGWQPKVDINSALEQTLNYYQNN